MRIRRSLVPLLLALGCGGRAEGPAPAADGALETVADPAAPPTQPTEPAAAAAASAEPAAAPPPQSPPSEQDLLRQETDALLELYCGECHGASARESARTQGGIGYMDDLDEVVERGLIVPLDSRASRVVQVMRRGSMPPPGVEPRPSEVDIDVIADFIDYPQFYHP